LEQKAVVGICDPVNQMCGEECTIEKIGVGFYLIYIDYRVILVTNMQPTVFGQFNLSFSRTQNGWKNKRRTVWKRKRYLLSVCRVRYIAGSTLNGAGQFAFYRFLLLRHDLVKENCLLFTLCSFRFSDCLGHKKMDWKTSLNSQHRKWSREQTHTSPNELKEKNRAEKRKQKLDT